MLILVRKPDEEMIKNLFTYFLFMLFISSADAQVVSGIVLNEQHQGIPYATIRLLQADSTFVSGAYTDSMGRYSVETMQHDCYLLHVSSVGYKSQMLPIAMRQQHVQLTPIILKTDYVALEEVTVKASSFVRQADKLLIFPDKKQIKHAATGYDLLYKLMIPEMDVNRMEGKVLVPGGEATVYIDGRKVDAREIRGLNPNEIEKIEYHDVPSGKYMNDIASINFITKKYKSGGYLSVNMDQRIGYLSGNYNAVAKVAQGNTSYTLFAGHSNRNHQGMKSQQEERFVFSDHVANRTTATLDSQTKSDSQYAQLNISHRKSKRSLTGKASVVHLNAPDNYSVSSLNYHGQSTASRSFRNTLSESWKPYAEFYGNFQVAEKQTLDLLLWASHTRNNYTYMYTEDHYRTQTTGKESLYEMFANMNYSIRFASQRLLALQAYYIRTVSSVDYVMNSRPFWQHYWDDEYLAFGEYNQNFGKKWSLRLGPGISYVRYRLHGHALNQKVTPRLRSRLVFRPAKAQQIQVSYHVGNSGLHINELNEMEQQIDSLQIRRGNPEQKIAFLHTLTMAYSGQFGRFNLAGHFSYGGINRVPGEDVYIENDKLIRSYQSEEKYRNVFGQLSAAWKATDNLRIKLGANWKQTRYVKAEKAVRNWAGNLQVDYFWNDFSCGVEVKSSTRSLDFNLMRITEPARYEGHINWSHHKWYIACGISNPFSKQREKKTELDRSIYTFKSRVTSRLYRPSGSITVAYTFDFGKKTTRDSNDIDKNVNTTIMKVE